ncbi:related to TAD2-subunit of tRNA-specific adenosine-34 deaminase [Sporisorium scitamineum]|uniref:Related to TAD2-subunit of tRNA-specific adenosine-34 deaminase n=1 Tax=Sporisorium scitamineum TaxID=49012 RepID=A0A127ZGQ5_9BASI|nr:related to TAD2-subunit of tRNA-specific adenosine-34 deaminase [Sporisorium scitamineum]
MLVATIALALLATSQAGAYRENIHPEFHSGLSINSVPAADRDHWMRVASESIWYPPVSHPCPQAPFGTAIVNTTSNELICAIANRVGSTGDPTQHGEITAIQHCTNVLQKKGLTPQQILAAWKDFSLYTNAEPCTMCLSAIRWAGFKEVIYGTSVRTIAENGRNQIYIPSNLVLEKSYSFGHATLMLGNVLTVETDPLFKHQFNESAPCPVGCHRTRVGNARVKTCEPVANWQKLVHLTHADDERVGAQPTGKTPFHIEL